MASVEKLARAAAQDALETFRKEVNEERRKRMELEELVMHYRGVAEKAEKLWKGAVTELDQERQRRIKAENDAIFARMTLKKGGSFSPSQTPIIGSEPDWKEILQQTLSEKAELELRVVRLEAQMASGNARSSPTRHVTTHKASSPQLSSPLKLSNKTSSNSPSSTVQEPRGSRSPSPNQNTTQEVPLRQGGEDMTSKIEEVTRANRVSSLTPENRAQLRTIVKEEEERGRRMRERLQEIRNSLHNAR